MTMIALAISSPGCVLFGCVHKSRRQFGPGQEMKVNIRRDELPKLCTLVALPADGHAAVPLNRRLDPLRMSGAADLVQNDANNAHPRIKITKATYDGCRA